MAPPGHRGERTAPAHPAPSPTQIEMSLTNTNDDRGQSSRRVAQIVDIRRRRVPTVRRTQEDIEATKKVSNIVRLVDAGYVSMDEAEPWIVLEAGGRS